MLAIRDPRRKAIEITLIPRRRRSAPILSWDWTARSYSVCRYMKNPPPATSVTGQFNDATYASLVRLTAYLCERFSLDTDDVIRHYDVTGKLCPLYYVEHEDAWEKLRADIGEAIKALPADGSDAEN